MFLKGGDGVGEIKKVEDRSEVTVIFRGDSVSCCGACCAWCLKVCFLIKMLCCGRVVCYLPLLCTLIEAQEDRNEERRRSEAGKRD